MTQCKVCGENKGFDDFGNDYPICKVCMKNKVKKRDSPTKPFKTTAHFG